MTMTRATFDELLRTQKDRVYSYALYVLRNREDAEDVVQETFIRAWRRCDAQENRAMLAFLNRTAHNLCIDAIRRRRRTGLRIVDPGAVDVAAIPGPRTVADDPELKLESDDRRRVLLDALAELPPEDRSFVVLHYFQGLTFREIAAACGGQTSTIKVRVHRARGKLRRALGETPSTRIQEG
jgi:RNA polymerase sigma-70 factor (ECF subfamily)